ncbi:MAG: outer rane efflux protein [Gemmatimonadetes bacterium]|nr:outer rane efflux protein [Gemmatimonadota bacterium]
MSGSRGTWRALAAGAMLLGAAAGAGAQTAPPQQTAPAAGARALSLDEALGMAGGASEQVGIARAGITRARGQQAQSRSAGLPQLNANLTYTRTLKSQFSSAGLGGPVDTSSAPLPTNCPAGRFTPNPSRPLGERVDSLEHLLECQSSASSLAGFSNLGFGAANAYNLGLNLQQSVFSGGRVTANNRIAAAGRENAEIALTSAQAQVVLDVTQAYYDAALSDRLVSIAEAGLAQSEETLRQTELGRRVGNLPEFDLLRAQVARDNQRPVVIQRRSDRELAYLRLKQLLNVPLDQPLTLTSTLGEADSTVAATAAARAADSIPGPDTLTDARAVVRQAATAVTVGEQQLRVARSQRLPQLTVNSQYGRVAYPDAVVPSWSDFRTNWTVGAAVSLPLFTGGRIHGDELVAQAGLQEARARLQQTRELAQLDTRTALTRLTAARSTYEASAGTARQALRAYQIAEVRYREGVSTQLELADSRLSLQQAQANQAQAARDLQIARARVRLLRDLPLSTTGAAGASTAQQQTQAQTQSTQGTQSTGAQQQGTAGATQQTTTIPGAGQ